MSYESLERSWHSGQPVEIYRFYYGEQEWNYSSGPTVEHEGVTYEAFPIGRTEITQTKEIHKAPIEVIMPRNSPLSSLYLTGHPERIVSLTIFRAHMGELYDYYTYWKGRVVSVSWPDAATASFSCESVFTSLKRPGLRAKYQRMCRHALYSQQCGVDMGDYAVPATIYWIDEETKKNLEVGDISGFEYDWFNGGFLETPSGGFLSIAEHSGSYIKLAFPCNLEEYSDIVLFPGCTRQREMCKNRYDNLLNFGGFPWIPSRNPFDGRSMV